MMNTCTQLLLTLGVILLIEQVRCQNDRLLYRHGERTPTDLLPNFPASLWPEGLGQLTNTGKVSAYNIGERIVNRYVKQLGLVSESFKDLEIFARSTQSDRTSMTGQLELARQYIPKDQQIWNPNLNWQPIPIFSIPTPEDPAMRSWSISCKRKDRIYDEIKRTREYRDLEEMNKDLFDFLSEQVGTKIDLENVWIVDNVLEIMEETGIELPPWVTPEIQRRAKDLAFWKLHKDFDLQVEDLRKLLGGPIMNLWLNNIKNFINGKSNGQMDVTNADEYPPETKLVIYSAHDLSIISLLAGLGIEYTEVITYGTTAALELWESENGEYSVRFQFYRPASPTPQWIQQEIPNCGESCPLNRFEELLKDVVLEDFFWFCDENDKIPFSSLDSDQVITLLGTLIFFVLFFILALTALAISLSCILLKKDSKKFKGDEKKIEMNQL